jgi:iron complex outermembrane receptor protein
LGRVRVAGAQAYAEWRISPALRLRADYLFDSTDIERAPVAPSLVGNRLVEVPLNSGTLGATWVAPGSFTVTPRVRWIGAQFVDDQNQLRLPAAVVVDVTVSRAIGSHGHLFLTVENLGDAEVETALSTTGVVNIGTPRLVFGGFRWSL